ncbi:hypothetical protein QYM36_004190 [Artemia franciscana]|uniref:RNase H type-1 domain-containing protein n=1 Tax=Artemia franciscana TaxID=6661 RepID=A0AA88I8F0_ARTSF|nr:hypothetical protein QYM36_004190 [Artemia franciscana]
MFLSESLYQPQGGRTSIHQNTGFPVHKDVYEDLNDCNLVGFSFGKPKIKIVKKKMTSENEVGTEVYENECERFMLIFRAFTAELMDGTIERKEKAALRAKEMEKLLDPCIKHLKAETKIMQRRRDYKKAMEKYGEFVKIFTDGSALGEGVAGCAVAIPELGRIKIQKIQYEKAIQAELQGLLEALLLILDSTWKLGDSVVICTDALTGLESLMSVKAHKRESLIRRIQDTAFRASKKLKVLRFMWVPAHMGIADNEQADLGARHAANIMNSKPDIICYDPRVEKDFLRDNLAKKAKFLPKKEKPEKNKKKLLEPDQKMCFNRAPKDTQLLVSY